MSSRKNRNSNVNPNASNRNLDGRRLRTVDEAKRLADYLAIKPEMEKKEREARKQRWQEVVDAAERREEEIRSGKNSNKRLDAEWVESKEEVENKTREAVMRAMREGMLEEGRTGSESSVEEEGSDEDEEAEESSGSSEGVKAEASNPATTAGGRSFFGWDEDEEDDSEDDDEVPAATYEGKGKGKAKA